MADLQGIGVGEVEARAQRFATEHRMEITTEALHRSLTLSGGNIAQPSRVSGINPGQNVVSGIVDMVRVVPADGMGEDSVAYEVSGGQTAATKKDDGSATPESTPNLKIAKIVPTLVTTLSYVSRNIQRTTPLNYQDRVSASALNALRAKTGTLIVTATLPPRSPSPRVFSRPRPSAPEPTSRFPPLTRPRSARSLSATAARRTSRAAASSC